MRRLCIVVVMSLVLCLLALGCGAIAGTSSAQCAPAALLVEPARVAPNEPFQLHGENFFKGCEDTNDAKPQKPIRNVRVVFVQGDQRWLLATVDANRHFAFEEKLRVPADAASGRAIVKALHRFDEPANHPLWVLRGERGQERS